MKGFTLIELLIALSIFAIIATITSSSLYHAFHTRAQVNAQTDRLTTLQLAISVVQQDTSLMADRAIRTDDLRLIPPFIGENQVVEFTRRGIINPGSLEQRSTLKRIALLCLNNSLIRRTWASLDPIDRKIHEDKVLVDNLSGCYFNYIDHNLQILPEWREQAVNKKQQRKPFPKAVQLNLTLNDWGEMNLLFVIPEGLYG